MIIVQILFYVQFNILIIHELLATLFGLVWIRGFGAIHSAGS